MVGKQIDLTSELELINYLELAELALSKNTTLRKIKNNFQITQPFNKPINMATLRLEGLNANLIILGKYGKTEIHKSSFARLKHFYQTTYNATYNIYEFSSENFNSEAEYFYRLVIPNAHDNKIRLHDFFCDALIGVNNHLFSGITFNIENNKFNLCFIEDCLLVECESLINYKTFDKLCRLILGAFGFVTGYAPMGCGYYFAYQQITNNFIQFLFTSSFYNTYEAESLLTTNPYEFYSNLDLDYKLDANSGFEEDQRITVLKNKLKPLQKIHFETLITKMSSNDDFLRVVFNYLSINSLSSFDMHLKSGFWAILLETLTGIINKEHSPSKSSVTQQAKPSINSKSIRKKLHQVAKQEHEKQGIEYSKSIIETRINNICTPLNSAKLTLPYDLLDIPLTPQDIKHIRLRNQLLHGVLPFDTQDREKFADSIFYTSLELCYLVTALIYKFIGFDGVLKNNAKIYLDYKNVKELVGVGYFKEISSPANLTLVTIVLNDAANIETTLKSVLEQSLDLQYIVIDGGSTDGTLEIIEKYKDKIDVFISEKDAGIYDAMNKAVALATNEWVCFMNSGDYFHSTNTLAAIQPYLDNQAEIVYGDWEVRYNNKKVIRNASTETHKLWQGMLFSHQSCFVRKELLLKYKFNLNNPIAADYEFFYTLFKQGYKFKCVPLTLASVSARGVSDKKRFQSILARYKVIDKTLYRRFYYGYLLFLEAIKLPIKKLLRRGN